MAKSDYRRPADYQISNIFRCISCGSEIEKQSIYAPPGACHCGGDLMWAGESYPASSDDWEEERDGVNEPWRRRR